MKLFKCGVCGMIVEGEEAPAVCPKCGAPREKFELLDDEAAAKIYDSDRTNDIHMQLITLASDMAALCEEGIDLNLDPGCKSVFEKTMAEAWTIKQRCKAELATHMSKGKF